MSKIELFTTIIFGFLVFTVIFIRLGFFLGITINSFTLIYSFVTYILALTSLFLFTPISKTKKSGFISLSFFIISCLLFFYGAVLLSTTYDTSWDGQGYHQSAVIALANDWNPVRDPSIDFKQELPSQIFAEGYPSAIWELEATVYSLVGKINSAKIFNFIIAAVALLAVYILMRKLFVGRILSFIISILVIFQPIYMLQLLTFMQDGFGYQLLVLTAVALLIVAMRAKEHWAVVLFIMSEIFLVSTKYSFLPVALVLGLIFIFILLNRMLNKEYKINKAFLIIGICSIFVSAVFSYLPYIRNQIFHGAAFFPTNIPELFGSVKYNNIPKDLQDDNKISLLFYGIFSKSQARESGDPRSDKNIAELKPPFTFTKEELSNAGGHFNNRVGAGGPFFSGAVAISFLFLFLVSLITRARKERYTIYSIYFAIGVIIILALLTPTPNLLRYVSQLQLIPFVIAIPLYVFFKEYYIKVFALIILFVVGVNNVLFTSSVFREVEKDTRAINHQYQTMRDSGIEYRVKAQQFYSSYILLEEQSVPFIMVDNLKCKESESLVVSSTTTRFCVE